MRERIGQLTDENECVSAKDDTDLFLNRPDYGIDRRLSRLELAARTDQLSLAETSLLAAQQTLRPAGRPADEVADAHLGKSHAVSVTDVDRTEGLDTLTARALDPQKRYELLGSERDTSA
jgi:hypothetical protein